MKTLNNQTIQKRTKRIQNKLKTETKQFITRQSKLVYLNNNENYF